MSKNEIKIPEDVEVKLQNREIIVSGKHGYLKKRLNSPNIEITKKDNEIILESLTERKAHKSQLGTFTSHINNMIKGVQERFQYKVKAVYSHFPIKIETRNNQIIINNFLGEENPRKVSIIGEQTEVEVSDDEIIIKGPDKEAVSQTAARIEQETEIRGKDPRVFQDGIYVVERD